MQPHDPDAEPHVPAGRPLTLRRALLRIGVVTAVAAALLVAGAANGVGPLATVTPPDQVTDPREMLARSLQSVIDASSVHVEASLSGQVPGAIAGRPAGSVTLDGTTASLDLRPQDARSHLTVTSAPLGIDLEALTHFDTLAYRAGAGPWATGSLAGVVGDSGIDANPLTLVDRLRAWLAAPGAPIPTVTDVPCDAPSGQCRQVQLVLGPDAGDVLLRLSPAAGAEVGPVTMQLVVQADVATLRPAHVALVARNADGSLAVTLLLDTSYWDWPSVIADPPGA